MKQYKQILEAINRGIKLALDDFEDDVQYSSDNKSNIIDTEDVIRNRMYDNVVDMGLPSRTLWCKYNAGVDYDCIKQELENISRRKGTPLQQLDYISPCPLWVGELCGWGEIFPEVHRTFNYNRGGLKNEFNWYKYRYTKSDDYEIESEKLAHRLTKYCTNRLYGKNFLKDNLKTLQPIDDEATFDALNYKYPYKVKMPTSQDYIELLQYTEKTLVEHYNNVNGLNGLLLKSLKNGKELFFPYTGMFVGPFRQNEYQSGHYWCTDLFEKEPNLAYSFNFGTFERVEDKVLKSSGLTLDHKKDFYEDNTGVIIAYERYRGFAIRGIIKKFNIND